jgi:hypothetical protein
MSTIVLMDPDGRPTTAQGTQEGHLLVSSASEPRTASGAVAVGNSNTKYYEPFSTYTLDTGTGSLVETNNNASVERSLQGNSYGASYLKISHTINSAHKTQYMTTETFNMPLEMQLGLTKSQELFGQASTVEFVEVDDTGAVVTEGTAPTPISLGTSQTITSNYLYLDVGGAIKPGDMVVIYGCRDNRLNVGPVQAGFATKQGTGTIAIPLTLANASYNTTGGFIVKWDPSQQAKNSFGFILMDQSSTNIRTFSKVEGSPILINAAAGVSSAWRYGTTAAAQAGVFAIIPTGSIAIRARVEEVQVLFRPANSASANTPIIPITISLPNPEAKYKLRITTYNFDNLTRPVADITSMVKTASTTATVTTATPHGLSVGNYVSIIGARDQTNFASTNNVAVLTVPTSTTFTVAFGASATATDTNGGSVFLCEGSQSFPGLSQYVQSIAVASSGGFTGMVQCVLNGTASGLVRGEVYQLHGLIPSLNAYEGIPLRVFEISGTSVYLERLDATASSGGLTTITSTNTGGTLIRRTDLRLHSLTIRDYTHHRVELGSMNLANQDRDGLRILGGVTINASNNRLGNIAISGIWQDATTTTLAASATYTGTGRDLLNVATATQYNSSSTYAQEYRVSALADVVGDLYLEVSRDNTTYRRVKKVTAVQNAGAGQPFYAEIVHYPSTRYARAVYINGAGAQTYFMLQETYHAA